MNKNLSVIYRGWNCFMNQNHVTKIILSNFFQKLGLQVRKCRAGQENS